MRTDQPTKRERIEHLEACSDASSLQLEALERQLQSECAALNLKIEGFLSTYEDNSTLVHRTRLDLVQHRDAISALNNRVDLLAEQVAELVKLRREG